MWIIPLGFYLGVCVTISVLCALFEDQYLPFPLSLEYLKRRLLCSDVIERKTVTIIVVDVVLLWPRSLFICGKFVFMKAYDAIMEFLRKNV